MKNAKKFPRLLLLLALVVSAYAGSTSYRHTSGDVETIITDSDSSSGMIQYTRNGNTTTTMVTRAQAIALRNYMNDLITWNGNWARE